MPALWLIVLLFRLVMWMRSEQGSAPIDTSSGAWGHVPTIGYSVLALLLFRGGWHPVSVALVLMCAFPGAVARTLFIPFGVTHASYVLIRMTRFGGGVGAAVHHEVRARLACSGPPRWGDFAEESREAVLSASSDRGVGCNYLVARALLDASDGHTDAARDLLYACHRVHWQNALWPERTHAQAWLFADALQRGAYHEVVRLAEDGPSTCRRNFLRAASLRLLGTHWAPGAPMLLLLWLLSPGRLAHASLLRQALAARPRPRIAPRDASFEAVRLATAELCALPHGVATHEELRSITAAWQGVADRGELRAWAESRAHALGLSADGVRLESELLGEVEARLADVLRRTVLDAATPAADGSRAGASSRASSEFLLRVEERVANELLGRIENMLRDMPESAEKLDFDYAVHWRRWGQLLQLGDDYLAVRPAGEEELYALLSHRLINHAAWLYNVLHARMLANEMFRWLAALTPEDAPDRDVIRQNLRLSI